MTRLALVLLVAACGPKAGSNEPASTEPPPPMQDTRSEFEKRLAAACEALAPTLTACAVADSDAKLASGEITQAQHAELTKPEIRAALDKDWLGHCDQPAKYSTRQLRVLEVCKQEETQCEPLLSCLENMQPKQ